MERKEKRQEERETNKKYRRQGCTKNRGTRDSKEERKKRAGKKEKNGRRKEAREGKVNTETEEE